MVIGFRLALTCWLLYNMWTGHTWALYLSVTLLTCFAEMNTIVVRILWRRVDTQKAFVSALSNLIKP